MTERIRYRIGTRGSPLALAQAHEVRDRLVAAHGLAPDGFEITVIKTTGDMVLDRPLAEIGGKGLFTKEIEDALLSGAIDLAVHSMKDVQTVLPEGLAISCILEREDVRDAFISTSFAALAELPQGAVFGTSSLRRQAQLLRHRPDLKIIPFRGNVQTRLRKLDEGIAHATLLACAGLRRLGREDLITQPIAVEEILPAIAQGAIGIETRIEDTRVRDLLQPIHHAASAICVTAERAFLARLDGSCRTPIAGLAQLDGGRLIFRGEILAVDGRAVHGAVRTGAASDAARLGDDAASEVLAAAGPNFLSGRG